MGRVRELFKKFRNSDGRIKALTASGVTAVAVAIALLVGVLPATAIPGDQLGADVPPSQINYGGGDGGCAFVGSVAGNELHINNPMDDTITTADGVTFEIDVAPYDPMAGNDDMLFKFTVTTPGIVVYDVTVNGGAKSTWYDYDGLGTTVTTDEDLHAPAKGNGSLFNLSHINICYDEPGRTLFACGEETPAVVLNYGEPVDFIGATVTVLLDPVLNDDICPKPGVFYIDNTGEVTGQNDPAVFLDFGDEGPAIPIRFDVIKEYETLPAEDQLQYSLTVDAPPEDRTDMSVCNMEAADGRSDFEDVLVDDSRYPTNDGVSDDLFSGTGDDDAILCEVFDGSDADGFQIITGFGVLSDPGMW